VASQGPFNAGAGRGTPAVWINPSNVTADDGSTADNSTDSGGQLIGYTFGFSIPVGATITGIEVGIKRFADAASGISDSLISLDNGSAIGSNKAGAGDWSTTPTTITYGGPGDTWGLTLNSTDVNDPNFGVQLKVNWSAGHMASVDVMTMKIYYDPPTPMIVEGEDVVQHVRTNW
jgi:hypothetical protein